VLINPQKRSVLGANKQAPNLQRLNNLGIRTQMSLFRLKITGWRFTLAMLLSLFALSAYANAPLKSIDRPLPTFELPGIDESVWNADQLDGKVWVINFWATWCPPCIEEIPSMNAAWEVLEPKGIGMLAINAGEDRAAVESFLQKISIDFPTVLGNGDSLPNWSVRALPTTIVIDQTGQVVLEALGPREWDDAELLQQVIDLL